MIPFLRSLLVLNLRLRSSPQTLIDARKEFTRSMGHALTSPTLMVKRMGLITVSFFMVLLV